MALNARQRYLYRYVVDVWRQIEPVKNSGVKADRGKYSALSEGVPCLYQSTLESDGATAIGRTKAPNRLNMDTFHFEATVDVKDADFLLLRSAPSPSPYVGRWWAVQSNPETHVTLPTTNKIVVFALIQHRGPPGAPS